MTTTITLEELPINTQGRLFHPAVILSRWLRQGERTTKEIRNEAQRRKYIPIPDDLVILGKNQKLFPWSDYRYPLEVAWIILFRETMVEQVSSTSSPMGSSYGTRIDPEQMKQNDAMWGDAGAFIFLLEQN